MNTWHPSWWTESYDTAWDRTKEAFRRDWEQTKHDLHLAGGHELNQGIGDTLRQATDRQPIPTDDRPNPPKVIGSFDDVEAPVAYGWGARQKYGDGSWTDHLESELRTEWERTRNDAQRGWDDVKRFVRHGYEHHDKH
jgi:hypothetical protein